jgi:hypothetical protein
MAKSKLPNLDETARFYDHDTQRPRLRSAGLERYTPKRPRTGLRVVVAVAFFAGLLAILVLLGW